MVDVVNKFGINWKCGKAKTNNLYLVDDENSYNTSKMWFMLVLDKNDKTQYLAFHNTSANKAQIRTHITTSTYSNRQKLYEIPNIEINRNASRTDYDVVFYDKELYAIPDEYIDIIEKIDLNLSQYIQRFRSNISVQEYFIKKIDTAGFERKSYNQLAEWSVQKNGKVNFYYVPKKNGNLKLCLPLKIKLGNIPQSIKKDIPLGQKGNYTYPEKYPLRIDFIDCNFLEVKEFLDNILEQLGIVSTNITTNFNNTKQYEDEKMQVDIPLNQILYGPPGTGKTYNTILKAMSIIDGIEYNDVSNEKYSELKNKFDELKQEGQIEFVTFHQSYSYEEFVEGIKPELDSEQLGYKLEDGIFKQICNRANEKDTNNFDDVYEQFLETILEYEEESNQPFTLKTSRNRTFGLKINSKNNFTILAGKDLQPAGTLTKNNLKNISDWKYYAKPIHEYLTANYNFGTNSTNDNKPYVLIIDEINRGDVSKIFGELITLIEEDKRLDNKYQMTTTLPYSKEQFGVPNNLYIIGTMNTADRSIALLDTALRRRFDFEEIMPRPELLSGKIVADINLEQLLRRINERITEKYDRDHQIGHSYFMGVETEKDLERAYKNRILPLLNEYFYNDTKTVSQILNCTESELQNNFLEVLNKAQIS